ncbi:MAG: Ppx/GppA phosphatase family protein [Candidatus Obscuribacterales bacterium]
MIKPLLLLLTLIGISTQTIEAKVERRLALDIGSSTVKGEVADVDGDRVVSLLYSASISVPFRESLSLTNRIDHPLEERLRAALQRHLDAGGALGAEAICGIATAASRKALNGPEVLAKLSKELDIPLHIISQEEEGRLGYRSAMAISGKEGAVVWDSGGGSFQLTHQVGNRVEVYQGPIGRVAALEGLVQLNGDRTYVDPATAEALCALLKAQIDQPPPPWLENPVVAIANICNVATDQLGKQTFSALEVDRLIREMGDRPRASDIRKTLLK